MSHQRRVIFAGLSATALVTAIALPATAASAAVSPAASTIATTTTTPTPVERVAGANRIATAVAASQARWASVGGTDRQTAESVVISRYDEYADALGGAALAGIANGPLLLTHRDYLDSATRTEVNRILGGHGTVYVLGGTGAVGSAAAATLAADGYTVKRLAGADRYATSVKVSQQIGSLNGGHPQFIFATTGRNFPDGLAAGATAGGYVASVVLTNDSSIPSAVASYLKAEKTAGTDVYAVGGAAATASFAWVADFSGQDRYETAAMLADGFWGDTSTADDDPDVVGLATGENWPDALAGGALVATGGPLVLAKQSSLPTPTRDVVRGLATSVPAGTIQVGFVLGGTAVINDAVKTAFTTALNP